jgi:cell division septation protein DedD
MSFVIVVENVRRTNSFLGCSDPTILPISKQDRRMRWTTIGLSAGSQSALAPEPEPQPIDWKKRIASLFIPAILGLGLVMAFAYLGVRIVAGKSQSVTPVIATQVPAKQTAPPPPPAADPVSQPDPPIKVAPPPPPAASPAANFTVITPQPGERYLQVAAVSPHMVLVYIDKLQEVNLTAVVAPGPTPDLLRILVGPFPDRDSMDQTKAQLITSGRSPIVRVY